MKQEKFYFFFFAVYFFFWLFVSFGIHPHPDVLDHWGWSRKLQWGYLTNPPMISYWMRFLDLFIPHREWTIQLGGIISSTAVLVAAYWAAKGFLNTKETKFYLLILAGGFYYSLMTQFWTIEQPYNFFWFLALGSWGRYLTEKNILWLYGCSIFFALGILSKYIIVLFAITTFLFLFFDKKEWKIFTNLHFYLAILLGLLILFPHLYWNYQRDFASFKFLLTKGFEENISWKNLWQVQLGHLAFFSFFFSLPAWFALLKKKKQLSFSNEKYSFLFIHSIIPILFFSYSSMTGRTADPNWMAGGYITVFIVLAKYFSYLFKEKKKFAVFFCYISSYTILLA